MLDCMYGASFSIMRAFTSEPTKPRYPASHDILCEDTSGAEIRRDQDRTSNDSTSMSIGACCSSLLTIWGDVVSYLGQVKEDETLSSWSENSPYQKIVAKLYQFESNIGDTHRIRRARPDLRSSAALEAGREYWAPWLTMQLMYHAVQALIHHPLIHVARTNRCLNARSPSFLQRTVDQLILHSNWVTKFIDLCTEKDFVVNDPFLAHLTAIVATCYMFFLNSDEPVLARKARQGLDTCYDFVNRFTQDWNHIKYTVSPSSGGMTILY